MSNPNIRPSDRATVAAVINPASQGAGSVSSGWVSMAEYDSLLAVLEVGAFGASATVDAKLEQATDGSGTGAKDITGKAITQLVAAGGNNRQALINCRSDELDVQGGYTHVRLTVTVGVAATLISAVVLGLDARYQPHDHAASVAQVVS